MKIGVISYAAQVNLIDVAKQYHEKTIAVLQSTGHSLVCVSELVMDDTANEAAIDELKNGHPEMIVLELGSFAQGNMIVEFIQAFKDTPLFIRGYNDPIVPSFPTVPLNSLTGFIMTTSFLKKTKVKFSWTYADIEDEEADRKLMGMIKAIEVKTDLRKGKYAIVGSRAPGFYLSMVDELRFRNQIGPEIVYLSIGSLLEAAQSIDKKRILEEVVKLKATASVVAENEQLEKNIRLYLALSDYVDKNKITALTMKCWPELQTLYHCAGCAALSWLNEKGIPASCEGDVAGLCTMDILYRLSDKRPVFFADLVGKSRTGAMKAWHCGFGPRGLCKENGTVTYTEQPTMRNGIGVGVQYEMQTGYATMCKLSEQEDGYKLLMAEGQIEEADRAVKGVQADISLDVGFTQVLEMIVENGFEQHYAVVHGVLGDLITEFSKWTDIKCMNGKEGVKS